MTVRHTLPYAGVGILLRASKAFHFTGAAWRRAAAAARPRMVHYRKKMEYLSLHGFLVENSLRYYSSYFTSTLAIKPDLFSCVLSLISLPAR